MIEPDAMPNRSALFAIPPIVGPGAGTESLISYLVRVARAHQVKVRSLVREQIWSAVVLDATSLHIPFFKEQARTVNGVGRYARAFSGALQALTLVEGLERLTFLPWQGVIPEVGTGFLATEVKWCPECLAEHRAFGVESHFPLVWSLEYYRVCLRHQCHLERHCPWCGKTQHVIPYYPDQARCTHCCGFLAPAAKMSERGPITERERRWARSLESMMADEGETIEPTQDQLILLLKAAAEQWAEGERKRLSLMLGLGPRAICGWTNKKQKPAFPLLLQIAEAMGVTLHQLFSQPLPEQFPGILPTPLLKIGKRQGGEGLDLRTIESQLATCLHDPQDTRPVSQILQELNLTRSYAKYWFPELLQQLGSKHRTYRQLEVGSLRADEHARVEEVFQAFVARGEYPSIRRISKVLKPYRLSLKRPELREQYKKLRDGLPCG